MDASDVMRKKQARFLAAIQKNPTNTVTQGQVPNNPPLTPGEIAVIESQYPKTDFSYANNIYPCGTAGLCSTIYTAKYYYNSTN